MSEMTFKRKFYDEMLEWKETSNGTSALMIDGARRVGKSTVAETFAKNEYDDYLLIDFVNASQEIKDNFENLGNMDVFFRNLFLFAGKSLKSNNSVIIFDEVQKFPRAREAIKYLVKDGRYHYIETGSLISIKKKSQEIVIPSEEDKRKMYPMDFEEFLWATGDDVTAPYIRECFEKRISVGEKFHRKFMTAFRTYFAIGGMPQAVDAYVQGKDYRQIDMVKRNILSLYEEDLGKYDDENNEKTSAIFKAIPEQLSNHSSKFKFSGIDENARYKNYVYSVRCVAESMIGNCCRNVTDPQVTLDLFAESDNFKLFMGDTGLLVTQILKTSNIVHEELYKKIIGKNPSYFVGEKLPVEKVSWLDAVIFCNKLSVAMGKRPCYSQSANTDTDSWVGASNISCNYNADGYRLPTEAEWEFAARGGTNNETFLYSGSSSIDEVAWYEGNSEGETHEVATKAPNSLGLYDMSGNVWEWCWDNYSATYYVNGSDSNVKGPAEGKGKVLRGGSRSSTYGDGSSVCRVTNRNSAGATERYYLNGFRIVNAD